MKFFLTQHFKRQIKKLKKRYPHVKQDFISSMKDLDLSNEIHLGNSLYKKRIASSDMKKGKSGGFRAYLYYYLMQKTIIPIAIYSKSTQEKMTEEEIAYHFDCMTEEIVDSPTINISYK